jgi:hypothetical protein
MDSILGKVVAAILVTLAVAGVVVYATRAYSNSVEGDLVSNVATLAAKIRGDYANNANGYASLTNAVAIAAGDVPASMLSGASSIHNPWGANVALGPVPGLPADFFIDAGAVPVDVCVKLLTTDGTLMGAGVGGKQVAVPTPPNVAAQACAGKATNGVVDVTTQYGQVSVPVTPTAAHYSAAGTYTFLVPMTATSLSFSVAGAGGGGASPQGGSGGAGGSIQGTLKVTGGQTVSLTVGAGGAAPTNGYWGGYGGGFSAIEIAGQYAVVAGGGGGAGGFGGRTGGGGGGDGGQIGQNGGAVCDGRQAGLGGTNSTPGGPEPYSLCGGGVGGNAANGMIGGAPNGGVYGNGGGGGGGAGFYAGGGGATGGSYYGGGGGGGGADYANPLFVTSYSDSTGGGSAGGVPGFNPGADGSVSVQAN